MKRSILVLSRSLALATVLLSFAAGPAQAAPGTLEAQLTVFIGDGTGSLGSFPTLSYSAVINQPLLPVTLPSGVFTTNRVDPVATNVGGPVPLPSPNAIFVLRQVINQTNASGSFDQGRVLQAASAAR